MSAFPYAFDGRVSLLDFGRFAYFVIYLPGEVAAMLPLDTQPRLRARGEVDDYAFHGAWMPSRNGWYLKLSKDLVKRGGYSEGSWVYVRFRIAGDDEVDVPDSLVRALEGNKTARKAWSQLTPGAQRGLAYRVASAKTAHTAEKRTAEVINTLTAGSEAIRGGRRPSAGKPGRRTAARG